MRFIAALALFVALTAAKEEEKVKLDKSQAPTEPRTENFK